MVLLNEGAARARSKHLHRDPRLSLCVEDGNRYVTLSGPCALQSADQQAALNDIVALAVRYMGAEQGEKLRAFFGQEVRETIIMRISGVDTRDFAARLEETGEYVDHQALSPEGTFVRYGGEGQPPVTDGPFAETKDLIAGWMVIDVESYARAIELAGELSAAPGAGGKPTHEWLEVRPLLGASPAITE